MLIGVPKEIKTNENRIALVPAGAEALVAAGHQVLIEKGAGEGSGFDDAAYTEVGAQIADPAVHLGGDFSLACFVEPHDACCANLVAESGLPDRRQTDANQLLPAWIDRDLSACGHIAAWHNGRHRRRGRRMLSVRSRLPASATAQCNARWRKGQERSNGGERADHKHENRSLCHRTPAALSRPARARATFARAST